MTTVTKLIVMIRALHLVRINFQWMHQTMNIHNVTDEEDNSPFLLDLPITTKEYHRCKEMLHLKADIRAEKKLMKRKLYVALTGRQVLP